MADGQPNCNCLTGTPYLDSEGNCRCANEQSGPLPPLSKLGMRLRTLQPQTINYNYNLPLAPASPTVAALAGKAAGDGTIFGLSPVVVLAIAAAGFYFMSTKDGKNA